MTVARAASWPHHGGMSIPHARAGERGASILSGLVLMAMLGAAVVGVGSSNSYQSQSRVAAAVSVIKDTNRPTTVTVGSQTYTVTYACYQVDNSADIKKLEQDCEPGFSYTINETKGSVTVTPTPTSETACPTAAKDAKCTDGKTAKKNCSISGAAPKCSITYCVGGKACQNVGDVDPGKPLGLAEKRASGIESAFPGLKPEQLEKIVTSGINDSTQKGLEDALTQAKTKAAETTLAADEARRARDAALNNFRFCEGDPTSSDCSGLATDAKKAETDAKAAQEKAAAAQEEYKKLAATKVALTPPDSGAPETPEQKIVREKRETEQRRAAEIAERAAAQQQQTGFGQGGLGKMVQGPMGGKQQKGGAGGAPSPLNGGPCTPGYQCKNNTLYYQSQSQDSVNNYCNAQPVQQCQYGCSSATACAQSPNQGQNCPAAPQQPD